MSTHPVAFTKMTGAGNDFVLIDNRSLGLRHDWSAMAPDLCDRRYGIGADGLLVLQNGHGDAKFVMEYYNADGSHGGMCGNGGRCAALYTMQAGQTDETTFEAVGHLYQAKRLGPNTIRLHMKDISSMAIATPLNLGTHLLQAHYVDSGTAHVVLWYDDLPADLKTGFAEMDIHSLGKAIRMHDAYAPGGTNVNVIQQVDPSTIAMRTYERGVEEETLACGTGAVASAVVSHAFKHLSNHIRVITRSNEVLQVSFTAEHGRYSNVHLHGPAKFCFDGQVDPADLTRT